MARFQRALTTKKTHRISTEIRVEQCCRSAKPCWVRNLKPTFYVSFGQRTSLRNPPCPIAMHTEVHPGISKPAPIARLPHVEGLCPGVSKRGGADKITYGPFSLATKWGPSSLAKLVNITPITIWFMVYINIVNGIINQLITGGAPPCMLNRQRVHGG